MSDTTDVHPYQRAEHWLLAFINERMMQYKPEKYEPDQYSTEIDIARVKSCDEGWWSAMEQLSILSEAIRRGDWG